MVCPSLAIKLLPNTVKNRKVGSPEITNKTVLKMEHFVNNAVMRPNDADGITNIWNGKEYKP